MKVKALWGFVGNKGRVYAGDEIEVSQQYGHSLIGKGLAAAVSDLAAPNENKKAEPAETQEIKATPNKKATPTENKKAEPKEKQ